MLSYCFINDQLIETSRAMIPALDLSIHRGYGVFDSLIIREGEPRFMKMHLDRLFRSASALRLTPPATKEEIATRIRLLVHENRVRDAVTKINITGGASIDGITPGASNLIITQMSYVPLAIDAVETGIHALSFEHQRQLPEIKSIDYLMSVYLQQHLEQEGVQEVIYHKGGLVSESPRSNVFIVKNEQLFTPASGMLEGITRKRILEKFGVVCSDVHLDDLYKADELFLTSSTKQVLPVVSLDGRKIGTGKPEMSLQVRSALLD